ncbi:MAG: TolC family protein [Bacteroidetes bacterium]|nr:TolC family protein [Bacteroidota bacterium]
MNYKKPFYIYLTGGILGLVLFAIPLRIGAQNLSQNDDDLQLSLEEATELALEQNFTLEQAGYDVDKTRAQYRQTNAVFLPRISFEYNAVSTNDPLNVFGFKLKQEIVTQQDFNPALLTDPDVTQNYSAAFKIQQPLLNPDMFLQRSAVKNQLNSADEQLAGTRNYVEFQVRNQYYSLILHHRQLDVLETALETAAEHRRQAQNFFEEGLISKEDFLAARVYELEMESRKLNTENQLAKVEEEMAILLGMDGSVKITPTEDLARIDLAVLPENLVTAPINNAQTRAIEYRVNAAENMVKSSNFSFLPKVNLFGYYEFNDPDFAGFDASSYMIGANLTWTIFSGYSNIGKVMEAKADYRKAQSMQQNHRMEQENQVRQAYRALEHAQQELELTDESIAQSEEDVKIRTNRYEQGMQRTTDLLEAETKLAEARLKNVAALYKYNMSIATLEMLLEKDLNN